MQNGIWLWDALANEWIKFAAQVIDKRITATGQVVTGHVDLHWILSNPSAGSSDFSVTDDTDGAGAVKFDHFDTTRDSHILHLDPPMHFTNGIHVSVLTNYTSLIFGYA